MIKQFVKGNPYFTDTKSLIQQYNYLQENIECDILVIGGGINGAITAYNFSKENLKVVLIDKSQIGKTSTSVATALLEYQLDEHANSLSSFLSKEEVLTAYNLGKSAIKEIESFISENGNHCHFSKRPTFVYTNKKSEVNEIFEEYSFRIKNNLSAEFFDSNNNPFPFAIKAGFYSQDGGAELNPYIYTHQLVEEGKKNGLLVFENTECIRLEHQTDKVVARLKFDKTITSKKVVICTGYDTYFSDSKPLSKLYTSYSITTAPIKKISWYNRALLHDNSNPYHYIRLTYDNRIIIGGEDTRLYCKIKQKKAERKYKKLHKHLIKLFPQLENLQIEYKFCGVFGTTSNNLGIVGFKQEQPNIYYNLGYGANGIINSTYASKMLVDLYKGIVHPSLYLFNPDRKVF